MSPFISYCDVVVSFSLGKVKKESSTLMKFVERILKPTLTIKKVFPLIL